MAAEAPQAWLDLVESLEPHVSPDWTRAAREHGGQGWVRLVALVDAHHQMSSPKITEKIASTMADLAVDRGAEQQGWEAIREKAREARIEIATRIVDQAGQMLPEELLPLFVRSVEPSAVT
jgi:hypothetical protein